MKLKKKDKNKIPLTNNHRKILRRKETKMNRAFHQERLDKTAKQLIEGGWDGKDIPSGIDILKKREQTAAYRIYLLEHHFDAIQKRFIALRTKKTYKPVTDRHKNK